MTYTAKDWSKAITKLTELTANRAIKWELTSNYKDDNFEVVDRSFSCNYKEARYVVKQIRKRNYIDENEFYWETDIKLEVYKQLSPVEDEMLISVAPATPVIGRLLSAIEASFAYQKGALDGLLDD